MTQAMAGQVVEGHDADADGGGGGPGRGLGRGPAGLRAVCTRWPDSLTAWECSQQARYLQLPCALMPTSDPKQLQGDVAAQRCTRSGAAPATWPGVISSARGSPAPISSECQWS